MSGESSTSQQSRRRRRSPVPLDIIQKNISVSMAQIIVNMTNPTLQSYCMQLLEITDVMQADKKLLEILRNVDATDQEKRNGVSKNHRQRTHNST